MVKAYSLSTQEGDVYTDYEDIDTLTAYLMNGLGTWKGLRLSQLLQEGQEDIVSDYLRKVYGLTLTVEDVEE